MSVCPRDNSNDPKVFKLGIRKDRGISYKWCAFGVKRLKVKVRVKVESVCKLKAIEWSSASC